MELDARANIYLSGLWSIGPRSEDSALVGPLHLNRARSSPIRRTSQPSSGGKFRRLATIDLRLPIGAL
jgi:hypothetical protein